MKRYILLITSLALILSLFIGIVTVSFADNESLDTNEVSDISDKKILLSSTLYLYDGSKKEPAVNIQGLVLNSDYTVEYVDNINAGTAKVIVTGKGNWTGTINKTFSIMAVDISMKNVKLSNTGYRYDGKAKTPSVTVFGLTKDDYTVTYSDNVKCGMGVVTIEGKNNCYGSTTRSFAIWPSKVRNVSVNNKTYDRVKVSWSKVKEADGYYVMYKKNNSARWTVKKTSGLSYTTGGLEDGYNYLFKVAAYAKYSNGAAEVSGSESDIKTCWTLKKMSKPKVSKLGTLKAKVSWSKCSGASGYQVCVIPQSTHKPLMVSTTSLSKKLSPVTKGNKYIFKVRAYRIVNGSKVFAPWSLSYKYTHK